MIQKGIYKVGDSPRNRGRKKNKAAIRTVLILKSNHIHIQPPRIEGPWDKYSCFMFSCHMT